MSAPYEFTIKKQQYLYQFRLINSFGDIRQTITCAKTGDILVNEINSEGCSLSFGEMKRLLKAKVFPQTTVK